MMQSGKHDCEGPTRDQPPASSQSSGEYDDSCSNLAKTKTNPPSTSEPAPPTSIVRPIPRGDSDPKMYSQDSDSASSLPSPHTMPQHPRREGDVAEPEDVRGAGVGSDTEDKCELGVGRDASIEGECKNFSNFIQ